MSSELHITQLHELRVTHNTIKWAQSYTYQNYMSSELHISELHELRVTHNTITWAQSFETNQFNRYKKVEGTVEWWVEFTTVPFKSLNDQGCQSFPYLWQKRLQLIISLFDRKNQKINISRSPVAVLNLNMDVWEISEGYLREFEEHFRDKHTAFSFLDDQLQVYRVRCVSREFPLCMTSHLKLRKQSL